MITTRRRYTTPLPEFVPLLIRHGADVTARDNDRRIALHLAAKNEHDRTVKALLDWECRPPVLQEKSSVEQLNLAYQKVHKVLGRFPIRKHVNLEKKSS